MIVLFLVLLAVVVLGDGAAIYMAFPNVRHKMGAEKVFFSGIAAAIICLLMIAITASKLN
jgi:hypothetical protein